MLDPLMVEAVNRRRPTMNKTICEGVAVSQTKHVLEEVNRYWLAAAEGFPEGLAYTGCKPCTPLEEFQETVRMRRQFSIAKSDVFMAKFNFSWHGKHLTTRYILLPYVRDGGLMFLNGTQYKVSPVIGGRIFNIERKRIYIQVPRARLIVDKHDYRFMLNNQQVNAPIVHTRLYNIVNATDRSARHCTLLHYLLADKAFTKVMKEHFNVDAVYGGPELDQLMETGEHIVIRSVRLPPNNKGRSQYVPSDIRIAIPADQYVKELDTVFSALFYIIDNCSETVTPDDFDEPELWTRILSRFIFKVPDSPGKSYSTMLTHMDSVRGYMDNEFRKLLASEGIVCKSFFDFLGYLITNFQDIIVHTDEGSMYDKELTTVSHLLFDIRSNIFTFLFQLSNENPERLDENRIRKKFDQVLRRDKIFSTHRHGELTTESIATDCKPYSATCNLVSANRASRAGRGSKKAKTSVEASQLLHGSQVEVGTFYMMSKAEPTSRAKANPFMTLSNGSVIRQSEQMKEEIESLQNLISLGK